MRCAYAFAFEEQINPLFVILLFYCLNVFFFLQMQHLEGHHHQGATSG